MPKIAILLPPEPDLGFIWRARAFASALVTSSDKGPTQVVIGLPEGSLNWEKNAARFRAISSLVTVRRMTWETLDTATAARMHDISQAGPAGVAQVQLPRDAGWSFRDCDLWLLCPSLSMGAVAEVIPSVVYCRDLSQRYVPLLVGRDRNDPAWDRMVEGFRDWRKRNCILASSNKTLGDLSSYAGVRAEHCHKLPSLWNYFRLEGLRPQTGPRNHILILCDAGPRHDILFAIEAYIHYLQVGGTLDLVIAGPDAKTLDPGRDRDHPITQALETYYSATKDRIHFENISDDDDLIRLIHRSGAIWSTATAEGEPDAMTLAAHAELPFIGCDFPAIRELADELKLSPALYQRGDAQAIAGLLVETVENRLPVGHLNTDEADAYKAMAKVKSLIADGISSGT
jgi:hypothetical protein